MKRKRILYIVATLLFLGFNFKLLANDFQDAPAKAPISKHEREKMEWKKQREIRRVTKAMLKEHLKHQTKEVRRSMRRNLRKANKFNSKAVPPA